MSRLCKKKPSVFTDDPLANSQVCQKLTLLGRIVSSSYGPHGGLKQVHNNVGGHVVTTSTSSVLLKEIQVSEPLLKLITTAILNHTERFSECGLFAAILCLGLINNAKRLDLRTSVAIKVYNHLLEACNRYLSEDKCICKVQIEFSSCQLLVTLAQTVITSKPACMLTSKEAQYVSSLVVQSFLRSVPCDSPGKVCFGRTVILSIEGESVEDSAVFPGLLVEMPEMLRSAELERYGPGLYKLVLFSTSLAGDLSEIGEATIEIHAGVNPEGMVLDQLLKLGEQTVRDEVSVFACQKVIHPVLQQYLREHGVVVIERLGRALMEPVCQLTGAQEVASLYSPVPPEAYGQIRGLCVRRCGSRELLHLLPSGDQAVSTMLLCHRNETVLDELKVVCKKAEHVLRLTLKDPWALLGGGCTETLLAAYIRHTSQGTHPDVLSAMGISRSELLLGVDAFCRSLESVALSLRQHGQDCLIDLSHAHNWLSHLDTQGSGPVSCGCGLIEIKSDMNWTPLNTGYDPFLPAPITNSTSQPRVLDSFSAKVNALNVAVEIANLILDVKCIIRDVN
ncbi:molecular chaperone MKKS [Chanos chanos]|uniref:Molecular chaperone MKKS n=1 Tax=Chanos chanos TaxID=29144 RepID=A0A6J2VCI1_CHACN|nr:McKusick-Kaufman/Bardet-Biedl syndromes putative chaperonin [Chanos chanos]